MMLHFRPEFVRKILTGEKRATIRLGKKGVKEGMIIYLAVGNRPFARAKVVRVSYKKLKELTNHEIRSEGYVSLVDLLSDLKKIYPAISPDDMVTYIEWRLK